METPSPLQTLDYNQIAAKFDRFLPQVQPVALAVLDHLPAPAAGETVLDVACGTGEPGLTLARRSPSARVLGVDAAAGMIAVAQAKAARDSIENARFEVMSSESLGLADSSVDSVISRFGLMMFGDVPASARELARVLRPGGHFSLAVWDEMAKNTLVYTVLMVLRGHLSTDPSSAMAGLNAWAAEGLRTRILEEAGLRAVRSEMFTWSYNFDSFDDAWDLVAGMAKITGLDALPPEKHPAIKHEVAEALSAHRQPSGGYSIPHSCRLIWGDR